MKIYLVANFTLAIRLLVFAENRGDHPHSPGLGAGNSCSYILRCLKW